MAFLIGKSIMQRDWDLIRKILLATDAALPGERLGERHFPGENGAVLFEHVRLLKEAGYLEAALSPSKSGKGGGMFLIDRLAWDGHDLIAKMKSEAWWSKVKKTAADKGLTLTFDVIKALALPAAKGLLGMDQD